MNTTAGHMPYKLRCLALASARSVWSKELFNEMCNELQVEESDVLSMKVGGYSLPELEEMKNERETA